MAAENEYDGVAEDASFFRYMSGVCGLLERASARLEEMELDVDRSPAAIERELAEIASFLLVSESRAGELAASEFANLADGED